MLRCRFLGRLVLYIGFFFVTGGNRTIEYTYDDNGSVIQKVTKNSITQATLETITYEYNLQNRLVSVSDGTTTVTYKYNPDGIRVQADDGTTVTDYLIDAYNHTGYAQVLEEWSGGTHPDITYTIGDDVISQYNSTDGTECLLYDGHGSTRQLVDSSEDITDAYSYDAYGVMLGGNPTSAPATSLLYAGEQFDTDAQQYYLRARYYDQNTGRFNRMDTFSGNNQDPQSLHKYLYCHANPVNNVDPNGMMSLFVGTLITISIMSITSGLIAGTISKGTGGSFASGFIRGTVTSFVAFSLMALSHGSIGPHVAFAIGGAAAQLLIEAVTGGFDEWSDALCRIAIAGFIAGAFAWISSFRFDILSVNTNELGAILADYGLREFVSRLAKDMSKTAIEGAFWGLAGRPLDLLSDLMQKTSQRGKRLTPRERELLSERLHGL